MARQSASGDVEGRAMIDRGADDRKADADVDAEVEAEQFHWDMALVVIHGHHAVEFALACTPEDSVGRQRSDDLQALRACLLDRRYDDLDLFPAKEPALARVRIQTGHGDARSLDAEAADALLGKMNYFQHTRLRDTLDCLA